MKISRRNFVTGLLALSVGKQALDTDSVNNAHKSTQRVEKSASTGESPNYDDTYSYVMCERKASLAELREKYHNSMKQQLTARWRGFDFGEL